MISFIVGLVLLIVGYLIYGKVVDKRMGVKPEIKTPAYTLSDGVDYIPMPTWKVFLIQFLNIAGTGPIFGAILGIMFGPAAFLWIVFGCIFIGATHDYFSGMYSIRRNGLSIPEIVGEELGIGMRHIMRVFSLVLLVLVGVVFVRTPADLIAVLTPTNGFWGGPIFWLLLILLYYILATLLPVDKLIGNLYPLFGAVLLFMAIGVVVGICIQPGTIPEVTEAFTNHHPKGTPLLPCLFITIACGAVSGFHSTQTPLMARCLKNEKYGRIVFYGAMITEGVVALIWAAGAIKFADSLGVDGATPYEKLMNYMNGNPANLVYALCNSWLGKLGAVLAVLGVAIAPITSGDTAFRSARLIASDFLHLKQDKIAKRLLLALPLFSIAIMLFFMDFEKLWRYFAWTNQSLACIVLWTMAIAQSRRCKPYNLCLYPAIFMTFICSTYIMVAGEGFELEPVVGYIIGGSFTFIAFVAFEAWVILVRNKKYKKAN